MRVFTFETRCKHLYCNEKRTSHPPKSNYEARFPLESANIEGFSGRLEHALGGESVNAFASRSGVGEGSLRQYLNGSVPGADKIPRIAAAANVNILWLMTGEGPMRPGAGLAAAEGAPDAAPSGQAGAGETPPAVPVPRYPARVDAGGGAAAIDGEPIDYVAFSARWLRETLGADPAGLCIVKAHGDSMEPTIRSGDDLMLDRNDTAVRSGQVYVLGIGDELIVKRLQRLSTGGLVIKSDNDHLFAPERLTEKDAANLRIVGRVRWIGRAL